MAVDTFFAGTLEGVGKVYIQTVLDCFSRHVWARLYTSKMPVTAGQILNNDALPFFEAHAVLAAVVAQDGLDLHGGRPDKQPCEVFKAGIPINSPARKKPARKDVKTAA